MRKWEKKHLLGGEWTITTETKDVRSEGKSAIRNHLSPKLTGAAAVIVIVGENTHNRPWVDYEVQHALSHHKKVLRVRLPDTTGGPPSALRNHPELSFNPNAILKALNS